MRILYGIQGTGNGHLTRARAIAEALKQQPVEVDYLVSGRPREQLQSMAVFGDYAWREGLTFVTAKGRISTARTLLNASLRRLWRDVRGLDLSGYDLVISDFEPVTAWAARLQGVECLALSHQAAFNYAVPKRGYNLSARVLMKLFAPAQLHVGLHWYHFNQPILPPVIDTHAHAHAPTAGKYVVYLPFESIEQVRALLAPFSEQQFYCYHPAATQVDEGHLHWRALSKEGFAHDLAEAEGVIANSGFELPSEALFLGKKLLVKPLAKQFEQESNAQTLDQLKLAEVMWQLDGGVVERFLHRPPATPIPYPDVAAAIAEWLAQGRRLPLEQLAEQLWLPLQARLADRAA